MSSLAASPAAPSIIRVCFARVGVARLTICWLGRTSAGMGAFRISFFLAAMIPFSVA